jgi:hypothetical protein
MSAGNIDQLLDLWASTLFKHDDQPPFRDYKDLYDTIDSTPLGDVPWQSFTMSYNSALPDGEVPAWMNSGYDVWYRDPRTVIRNMLGNADFNGEIDYAPFHEFDANGEQQYKNLMSGDWAWKQAVSLLLSHRTFNIFMLSSRILLPRIPSLTVPCLCPLSLAATRPQFLLAPETMNITHFMRLLEMFTIMCAVRTAMLLL